MARFAYYAIKLDDKKNRSQVLGSTNREGKEKNCVTSQIYLLKVTLSITIDELL